MIQPQITTQPDTTTPNITSRLADVAESFVPALVAGDGEKLAELIGPHGKIEDFKFGRIEGSGSAANLATQFQEWMSEWTIEKSLHVRTTDAGSRVISEDIIFAESPSGEKIEWPFATVACESSDNDSRELFIYYTIWPILKRHTKRPVIFDRPEIDTKPSPLLQKYHKCLTSGDIDGLYDVLAADVYIRESSGPPYTHLGITDVIKYFTDSLFKDGAPLMRSERLTSDGRCTFIEFTVIGWNGKEWPESDHQAGAGIWELNADSKLSAIRVYDDIEF
jgi:hypothetical protein